jgi:hypothetical protein
MPCTKCENGKYKWGKTGECKYDSKEECEKANPKKYSKMKPTPLGKKSYEEYAKELKEFNLSKVERVELALIDDIDKLLDNAGRTVKSADKKLISANQELLSATSPVAGARLKIGDALKMAKELGADEAIRLFNVRMEEVKYYEDMISAAHTKIDQGINELP